MAWYDDVSAGIVALGAAATGIVLGLGGALLKMRSNLAQDSSRIKQEKSDAHASTWLNEALIKRAEQAETERNATMRAAKELLDLRMIDVERIARLEEKLANSERESVACQDRSQRAESRAAVAEEHMRTQAEQMLVMSMNIDRLTTELARHDPVAAARLTPKPKQQPLLIAPTEGPP